jgi:hypothetical protein
MLSPDSQQRHSTALLPELPPRLGERRPIGWVPLEYMMTESFTKSSPLFSSHLIAEAQFGGPQKTHRSSSLGEHDCRKQTRWSYVGYRVL